MEAYYTITLPRADSEFTNEWNDFRGCDWATQTRGKFASTLEACRWARANLIYGAPFSILYVPPFED